MTSTFEKEDVGRAAEMFCNSLAHHAVAIAPNLRNRESASNQQVTPYFDMFTISGSALLVIADESLLVFRHSLSTNNEISGRGDHPDQSSSAE